MPQRVHPAMHVLLEMCVRALEPRDGENPVDERDSVCNEMNDSFIRKKLNAAEDVVAQGFTC